MLLREPEPHPVNGTTITKGKKGIIDIQDMGQRVLVVHEEAVFFIPDANIRRIEIGETCQPAVSSKKLYAAAA